MKETQKTLIIIAVMVVILLGFGAFSNYSTVDAEGSGSEPAAKPGEHYNVSIGKLGDLGLFRWWWCWMDNLYCRR